MKILVTGGAGYIGINFYNRYCLEHSITICDYGIKHPGNDGLQYLAQDLSLSYIEQFDGIVHLAALSGIQSCEENYLDGIEKNICTANNVFSKAGLRNIPVVFTSSQAAKEPNSSKYANFKYICEGLAKIYGSTYIIRLSNVYGGDYYLRKKNTVVKQFITKYKEGEPMEVHGNGKQQRDFIHVYDVCEAIMNILKMTPEDKSPMDIGTGRGLSMLDVINMFPNADYKFEDSRNAGTDSSIADISQACTRIQFLAKRKLEDYIKEKI
jgi:UDP-glucose 4-epimerase